MLQFFILVTLIEAIVEIAKWVYKDGLQPDRVVSLIIAVLVAVTAGLDLFVFVGIPLAVPYLGLVLTGVLMSRGANLFHDILGALNLNPGVQSNVPLLLSLFTKGEKKDG